MAKEKTSLSISEIFEHLKQWLEDIADSVEHYNLDPSLVQDEIASAEYLLDIVQKEDTKGGIETDLVLDLQNKDMTTENGTPKEIVIKASQMYEEIAGIHFYDRDAYFQLIEEAEKSILSSA